MLLILGDIHGQYELINKQIEFAENNCSQKVSAVIQLGDFGLFPETLAHYFEINNNSFLRPVYCIDGNHEDFWHIEKLAGKYKKHFSYISRGSKKNIEGYNFFALGGSSYMDPVNTPSGAVITEGDIKKSLLHKEKEIDIVISHDCPRGIGVPGTIGFEYCGPTGFKQGHIIRAHFRPKLWFYAHHHKWFSAFVGQTRFLGLDGAENGFIILKNSYALEIIKTPNNYEKPKRFLNLFKELIRR